jgi:hypothetical protein
MIIERYKRFYLNKYNLAQARASDNASWWFKRYSFRQQSLNLLALTLWLYKLRYIPNGMHIQISIIQTIKRHWFSNTFLSKLSLWATTTLFLGVLNFRKYLCKWFCIHRVSWIYPMNLNCKRNINYLVA